jgi:acyl-CoA reductase-like NAD-dependent aldehyde dehydrogenase
MSTSPIATDMTQWIGGVSTPSQGTDTLLVCDPATAAPIKTVPRGCPEDACAAVEAARQAQSRWAGLALPDRAERLRQCVQLLQDGRDPIAELLTLENGKPLAQAKGEIDVIVAVGRSLIEAGANLNARHCAAGPGELLFQQWHPRGVAACISTWNAPIFVAVEMIIANLIVGNTVVLKTSERAPLATRAACQLMFEQLPKGVLSVLTGDGPNLGEPMLRHQEVDVICFVGSVGVGRRIGRIAGERVRKAVLELGGKDAMIIDETVDLTAVAELAGASCFANSGQICTSTERLYVLRSVHDEFVAQLSKIAGALRVGCGIESSTQIGPLIDEAILKRVEQQVNEALGSGAKAVTGGQRLDRPGSFYPPTVLTEVTDAMAIMQEETFGPIAPIMAVDSFDEALTRANASEFGLGVTVCTESAPRALRAIRQLKSGIIKINTPRGQVPFCPAEPSGNSGLGMGHGQEFLQELTYRKAIHWKASLSQG